MSKKKYDVMCAGHLCIDMFPLFPETGAQSLGQLLQPGKLVNVGAAQFGTGGAVSNTGICMKILGNNVCFCARVADDELGRLTVQRIGERGGVEGIHVVPDAASSYTVVIAPPGIDRIFLHNPGTNDTFFAEDISPELLAHCAHFHFGYPPLMRRMFQDGGVELARVFQAARTAGASSSCDMSLPDPDSESGKADWPAILEKALPFVDIFLPSIEECMFMLERTEFMSRKAACKEADMLDSLQPADYTRLADRILELGPSVVVLKGGSRGIYIRTADADRLQAGPLGKLALDPALWANRELWCPSFAAPKVLSATGAGDSAVGGFLTAILRQHSPEDCLRTANCLGWQNVQALDSLGGLRSWHETEELLAGNLPMNDSTDLMPNTWNHLPSGLWQGPNDAGGMRQNH